MANEVVETIYGKRSKFEIYEIKKSFGGREFVIYKDGSRWKGPYDSLARAVEVAEEAG